jgi:sterol desaturase/sphingolipid hydroxylase (fatty acid hydroxylase superfamily)
MLDALPLSVKVWLVQMVAFHAFGLGFLWLERMGWIEHLRVRPPERMSYWQLLPRVLANQVFVLLPAMMAVQWAGLAFTGAPQIGVVMFVVSMIGITIGHDVVQYLAHRYILHRAQWMRSLGHSVHHSTNAARSISACYMSLADYFLEITCPYLVPLILVGGGGSDAAFHYFVVAAGAFGGLYEHSGYDFAHAFATMKAKPGLSGRVGGILAEMVSSHAHGEHHARGNVSYSDGFGSSGISDTVMKTRWDLVGTRERRRVRTADAAIPASEH